MAGAGIFMKFKALKTVLKNLLFDGIISVFMSIDR